MTDIRYYTDEHVANAVIRGLRQRGTDVLSVAEADMLGASDEAHLAPAYEQTRVVFTQDADFLRLAADGVGHAGIVYADRHTSICEIVRGLVMIHQVLSTEEMAMKIEFL